MDHHSITPPPFRIGEPSDTLESDATVIGSPSSITPHDYPAGLTSRELAHALRGEMLGHFLLQHYIGGGGMGVVFKALDTTLDRIVAVKVVASHRIDNDDLQRRFLVEAQSTARLDHPNIARVHYIGRDRGLPYIVFEYIDGVNIRELVAERGRLPVGEAISYVYQIAHALAHAWQRDVVHRDIKPSNILVTPDGQAKLVDMGLARLRQMDAETDDLTATGITLGTFDYISPEQARDPREADARSDIYSLGCTLFFMLAGQAPFAQGTALQKLLQHQSERPADLRSFRSDVPDSVARLSRRMLAKAPGDRQQSPNELVGELTEILDELSVPLPYAAASLPWSLPERSVPRWRRHAAWAIPVAALLLMGVVIDRFSQDDVAAAPFPALRTESPAPRAAVESASAITSKKPIEEAEDATADAAVVAPPMPAIDMSQPLPLREDWDLRESLWGFVANWPDESPASATENPISSEPAPATSFDAGVWPSPLTLPASPMETSSNAFPSSMPPSPPAPTPQR
ncbi:MAG: serine/threonine protein kinase [Pirellulales bacterium]|nr:serine/threonine protein kinase [Pirellulales bacterium]